MICVHERKGIQSVEPLEAICTSPRGRPVHTDTNWASLLLHEDYSLTLQLVMHIWRHGVLLWHILISVLSRTGEESFNKFLSPDLDTNPDHLRGGPSHGDNTSSLKKSSDSFLSYAPWHTGRHRNHRQVKTTERTEHLVDYCNSLPS